MSNIIIECRNKIAESKFADGDWQTMITPQLIESGDQIVVIDSFIDTQQSTSQNILIENDLDLTFTFGYYQTNIQGLQKMYRNFNNSGAAPDADFQNYVLTIQTDITTNVIRIIDEFEVKPLAKNLKSIAGNVTLRYTDLTGKEREKVARIPEVGTNGYSIPEFRNVIYDNQYTLIYEPPLSTLNLKISKQEEINPAGKQLFIPHEIVKTVRLPQGNYDPDELCETINTQMTRNIINGGTNPVPRDSILINARQIQADYHTGGNNTNEFALNKSVSADVDPIRIKPMYEYPNLGHDDFDIYFGASQFELAFDQASSRFLFKYIHTPLYNQSTLNTALYTNTSGNAYYLINKLGGVFFTDLISRDATTREETNFWSDKLGFELSNLLVNYSYSDYTTTTNPTQCTVPSDFQLVDSTNITGQLSVLDSVVSKTTPQEVTLPTSGHPTYFTADSQKTDSIFSDKEKSLDAINDFGYYLVEINSQFKNEFLTEDNNYNSIVQIVNRYYELNSYTSGQGGGIVYQHQGEPLLLTSFHCRILKSDKTLAQNVGDDNTIHLQIIKAPRPPSILEEQQTKDKTKEKK